MLEKGQMHDVEIIDMGMEGEGIGRIDGMAVFVNGAILGDVVRVELTQGKKSFARGRLTQIITPSVYRTEPPCRYSGMCGGCSLQAMSYEGQLVLKQKWVWDRLTRIGGIKEPLVLPVIGMEDSFHYRNKAQFPVRAGRLVKNSEGKMRNNRPCSIGFYQVKSHDVVQCDSCLIQAEPAEHIAAAVKRYVEKETVSVYDEKNHMGLLRHVIVRSAFETGEVMVILVVNGNHLPKSEQLIADLDLAVNEIPTGENGEQNWSLESVILNVNKSKDSQIMGKECITLAGKPTITDKLGDLELELSPQSFYQVNTTQMKKLYDTVLDYGALSGEETVLDLYCGVGTIGLYCAKNAKRVIGIESVRAAVMDANRNAVINGIVNAEYVYGKAEEILPKRFSDIKGDVVILDPPRSGCDQALLEAVIKVAAKRIVYVSCDPATQARDIKVLIEGGYQFIKAQPVDMFPHTACIECVVGLQRSV